MLQLMQSGGPLMVPIIACGVAATFIITERLFFYTMTWRRDAHYSADAVRAVEALDYDRAAALCARARTPCSDAIAAAIGYRDVPAAGRRELVQLRVDEAAGRTGRLLSFLATLGSSATMLGLLGTVTGNIRAFGLLGGGGSMGDPALLAASIAEALVTTVGGLCVAIPAQAFHGILSSLCRHRVADMEAAVTRVLLALEAAPPRP